MYAISTWLFLRALGLIYVAAFISLGVQVAGLIGPRGILPAEPWLEEVHAKYGRSRFLRLPTLCWLGGGDRVLRALCWTGAALGSVLVVGVAPALTLALLWGLYLSLFNVCGVFLGYQWDVLLLETGFLAIWLAPLDLLPQWPPSTEPHPIALGLAWWLLFRLMFSSGIVKLKSGDPTWRDLTALTYHYETQPLPAPLAWYAHQWPRWIQRLSCAVMFAIELVVPFLFFAPPPVSYAAAGLTAALMLLIMATGNYCFFNLLTLALCVLIVDDEIWRALLPTGSASSAAWPSAVVVPVAALLFLLSIRPVVHVFWRQVRWPRPLARVLASLEPFRLVSGYGLFAAMTTTRPEIIVEGSEDGAAWKPYEFRWKPGDIGRPPRYCIPHQPRLDWQLWFAALSSWEREPWFIAFLARLLENSRPVLALLGSNPFPDRPPRYVRALLYRYRYTTRAERRATGVWWIRELIGPYCPVLKAQDPG
jgi:hypothetical protein